MRSPLKIPLVVSVAIALGLGAMSLALNRYVATSTGLVRSFYPRAGFAGTPQFQETTSDLSLAFLETRPELRTPVYSVRWQGVWFVPWERTVDVYVDADGPAEFFVDGKSVLRRDRADRGRRTRRTLRLGIGSHVFAVEYQHVGRGGRLNVRWAPAGGAARAFGPAELFPRYIEIGTYTVVVLSWWLSRAAIVAWLAPLALFLLPRASRLFAALQRWLSVGGGAPVAAFGRKHRRTLERAGAVFGLTALALAQPVFDVVSKSPEFFVARSTTLVDAVTVVAVICGGLPLAIAAAVWLVGLISTRAATALYYAVVALLAAFVVVPGLNRGGASVSVALIVAAAVGLAAAAGSRRLAVVRLFLAVLAPAALVVPGAFLLDRGVREAFTPSAAGLPAGAIARTPLIVLIVFDEFPINSLLDADRLIDAVRYPNFAALAREGYWFRNASTPSSETVWAVPAIVSGRYPTTPYAVPTLRYYPNNLFTLLGSRYEMFAFGRFMGLCPASACRGDAEDSGDSVVALLADLAVVWLHIVLPEPLTDRLPPIVGDWRGFAIRRTEGERPGNHRGQEFDRFLSTIDGGTARLHFLHTLIPHMPFAYVPSGRRYAASDYQAIRNQGSALFERTSPEYADVLHQRHLLQVGYVDGMIGRLMARLREVGAYDSALIIVTADHGASYREGVSRRQWGRNNAADIMMVPLFVKVPGQRQGAVMDRNAETIDILPTIAGVLSIDLPFPVEGQSLLDAARSERPTKTFVQRTMGRVAIETIADWAHLGDASLRRKLDRFGSGATSLYGTPRSRDLLGRPISQFATRPGGGPRARLANGPQFASVDKAADTLPLYARGRIHGRAAGPLTIAVALNGVIAATTVSYKEAGAHLFGTLVPEEYLRAGANEIGVFVVSEEQGRVVLVPTR